MLRSETKIRTRYGETDQMGYVYYGVYAQYYEVGRVEAMRKAGYSYKDIEEKGILLPVIDYSIQYKKPAFYDDELTIITIIRELPTGVKLLFECECYNSKGELLNTGKITLVFIQKTNGKPVAIPEWFQKALLPFF
jgi:acyl-CoA thioester hydrolase